MSRRFVSVDYPGVYAYQDWLRDIAVRGAGMAHWQQVAFLAWCRGRDNGHANFAQGEIGKMLGLSKTAVSQEIKKAKTFGWLDPSSTARCLVWPDGIAGGLPGSHQCMVHGRVTPGRSRVANTEITIEQVPDLNPPGAEPLSPAPRKCLMPDCEDARVTPKFCREHHELENARA